ncbi:hypothetical protein KCU65_g7960, partial [Aureobasidium melanogenum]
MQLQFSPDGRFSQAVFNLQSNRRSGAKILIWDVETGKCVDNRVITDRKGNDDPYGFVSTSQFVGQGRSMGPQVVVLTEGRYLNAIEIPRPGPAIDIPRPRPTVCQDLGRAHRVIDFVIDVSTGLIFYLARVGGSNIVKVFYGPYPVRTGGECKWQELTSTGASVPPSYDASTDSLYFKSESWSDDDNRKLRGIHIFMITISGILGVGLYVRSGEILRLGGPAAVLSSFAILGFIAWAVMQCIAEMLCIWPVPGALVEFVRTFVDDELGIVVGLAYWFTYSINLSALITATAIEAELFKPKSQVTAVVLLVIMPGILFAINSLGVALYGLAEVIGGAFKIAFCVVILAMMIAINVGAGPKDPIGSRNFEQTVETNNDVAKGWAGAFFMSLSIAAFQFIGVEIPAATALEARMSSQSPSNDQVSSQGPGTSYITAVIYFVSGLLVCLDLEWKDPNLPITWTARSTKPDIASNSAFVIAAEKSGIPGLGEAMTVFLIFTALTAANTALYVSSRTLFSLTRSLLLEDPKWYIRILANCGTTNSRGVPLTALCVSCCFLWLPFLYLIHGKNEGEGEPVADLLDVLAQMGSVSCIMVWACECYAFIRFLGYLRDHRDYLDHDEHTPLLRRFSKDSGRYPYRSTGQPLTAYLALTACLIILVVANGATLWNTADSSSTFAAKFSAAYLAPICFILLWMALKVNRSRGGRIIWKQKNFSDYKEFILAVKKLNRLRDQPIKVKDEPRSWKNLGGLI